MIKVVTKKIESMTSCTECRAQSAEYRVQSTECRAQSTEHRVRLEDCRVQSTECRVQCTEHRVHSTEHRPSFLLVLVVVAEMQIMQHGNFDDLWTERACWFDS